MKKGRLAGDNRAPYPDPNLNLAVRAALYIGEHRAGAQAVPVTTSEIRMLKILHARKESYTDSIEDLTGLEFATDLLRLELDGNNVADITPLAGLTNLVQLDIPDNQITDITPLTGLTRLMELDLSGNQITDITPLAKLTHLWELNLSANVGIGDISPLVEMTGLRHPFSIRQSDH